MGSCGSIYFLFLSSYFCWFQVPCGLFCSTPGSPPPPSRVPALFEPNACGFPATWKRGCPAELFDSRSAEYFLRSLIRFLRHRLSVSVGVMDFVLCQNVLPVVIALAVIAISCYLWRRKFNSQNSTSSESGREKIQPVTADNKVNSILF